jgi:hypothetical protein
VTTLDKSDAQGASGLGKPRLFHIANKEAQDGCADGASLIAISPAARPLVGCGRDPATEPSTLTPGLRFKQHCSARRLRPLAHAFGALLLGRNKRMIDSLTCGSLDLLNLARQSAA